MGSTRLTCPHCSRGFSRREHLSRHCLIHSNEKPFNCSQCGKSYARRDVYHKHLRTHGQLDIAASVRQKAAVACDVCRDRKVKCYASESPCPRCKSAGIVCTFRGQPASSLHPSPTQSPSYSLSSIELSSNLATTDNEMSSNSLHHAATGITPYTEYLPSQDDFQSSNVVNVARTDCISQVGAEQLYHGDLFISDPYLTSFDDIPFQPLLSHYQDDLFGDMAAVYGGIPSDYNLSKFTEPLEPQTQTNGTIDELGGRQQQRLATAYAKLNDYSTLPYLSHPASPRSVEMHERYLQELGSKEPFPYDHIVIDVFIGLFQTHVAPTFPCFQNFRIESSTPEELYLAMAAAGGLYCNTLKSEMVAKWLHYYSRRKLLTEVHCKPATNQSRNLSILKTYILTEIFALVSGDKRSVSLSDIYYAQMIQAVRTLNSGTTDSAISESELQSVLNAVNLLECYRVVLLQRSSMLYPFSFLGDMPTFSQEQTQNDSIPSRHSTLSLLRSITSNDGSSIRIDSPTLSIQSLCALSLLISHRRRLPGSLSKYFRDTNGNFCSSHGWRQESLELALQKWLCSHTNPPLPGTLILFHTVNLSIYSNFAGIERSARFNLAQATPIAQESETPLRDYNRTSRPEKESVSFQSSPSEPCFTTMEDQEKSRWHANRILSLTEDITIDTGHQVRERVHLTKEAERAKVGEVTHYSHAVYHASMVLWWLDSFGALPSQVDVAKPYQKSTAQNLRRGIDLLSRSTSQVAAVFKQTLKALES